jgi:RNA polymerase sigma factor (sigma-70 family)
VLRHLPLVRHIAARVLPKGRVEMDDLVSAGTIALIEAADRYDPERRVSFATFAYPRIRGAIIDELPRLVESGADRYGPPSPLSLQAPLATDAGRRASWIDVAVDHSVPDPQRRAELSELLHAIRELPRRERELLALAVAGSSIGELARLSGCSEARISQVLTRARFRLEERTAA